MQLFQHRSERGSEPRRNRRTVALIAASGVLGASAAGGAVLAGTSPQDKPLDEVVADAFASVEPSADSNVERVQRLSRARVVRPVQLTPLADGVRFANAPLKLLTAPNPKARETGVIASRSKMVVTGKEIGNYVEILVGKAERVRYVNADYVVNKRPAAPQAVTAVASTTSGSAATSVGGVSGAPCADGSSVEYGLTSNAIRVYRSVCAVFPQPTTYGGRQARGEHYDGRALDIMITGSTGWAIANYLRANAGSLGVRTIIFSQQIWTPERAGEGWRYMSDRGSSTANHYDHVHVSVY